jgi:signal transduction histidine kinase
VRSERGTRLSYVYLASVAALVLVANIATYDYSRSNPDRLARLLFFIAASPILTFVEVRLDRGRLTLSGLATGAASVLMNPLDATLVGLAMGFGMVRRGRWTMIANSVTTAAATFTGAVAASFVSHVVPVTPIARFAGIVTFGVSSVGLVALALSLRNAESVRTIARHNFTPLFFAAYGYFALGSYLISNLINDTVLGYALATIVFVLALALTDTIAGRRVRRVLESELSDADRHLFHSRAVEGVVHNLRNHIATAVGYLKEIDLHRLDPVDRDAVETATAAANDAVTVLRSLAQGATPRVSYAAEPVDLNELATRALGMARPRARTKAVEMGLRETPDDVKVRADPLLLREVITNLVNNAIDAAPPSGHVELTTGRRSNGWPYFSVADNGPGVAEENRHHLFEPHFTTKEGGTGLGLFMSYGIIREHQGQLIYEGNRRGAVFTVTLPPFAG